MRQKSASRLAWSIFGVSLALAIVAVWLNVLNAREADGTLAITVLLFPGFGVVGAMIAARTSNPIGWLFLGLAFAGAFTGFAFSYAVRAVGTHPGSLPAGPVFALAQVAFFPLTWMILGFVLLLFPDGHLPSRRWRPVAWVLGATFGLFATLGLVDPESTEVAGFQIVNPLGMRSLGGAERFLPVGHTPTSLAWSLVAFAALAATVSAPFFRRRGAGMELRLQLRWLEVVCLSALALVPPSIWAAVGPGKSESLSFILFLMLMALVVVGIPVAVGIAVLKYRLYDLDLVIRKTVVFGLLAAFIAVVYAVVVGAVGALVGSSGSTAASFVAAAILAVLFQPARDRARRLADRLVYGKRATPYEVLTEFSGTLGEAYSADDILPKMAQVLAAGTGADSATVWLNVGGGMRPEATWPDSAAVVEGLPEDAAPVSHQGDLLGALSMQMPTSDPMNPAKAKLAQDLAAQAGLVLRNVTLIEDLRASRQRLVSAQDEERRKIERNLHDGAQQQLVALAIKVNLAQSLATKDGDKTAEMLAGIKVELQESVETLRDLARGIYPPLLADQGLAAALGAQARKAALPVDISSDGFGRFSQDVEAAAYFCCLEAMQNIAKYANATRATIALSASEQELTFAVTDDGDGFDTTSTNYGTGMQGMADRLDAINGSLTVTSAPGIGTEVTGRIPAQKVSEP